MQYRAQCHYCHKHTGYYPYLSIQLPISTHPPTYCPRCHRPVPTSPLDYADTLCFDYAGLTRAQALSQMNLADTRNAHAHSARSANHTAEAILSDEQSLKQWPSLQTLTTPLSIQCLDCGGHYIFYRNAPDIQRTPPLYCVWCASKHTVITQLDTEEHAFIALAQHYNLPVPILKTLYQLWTTQSPLPTFAEFFASPTVTLVLSALAKQANTQAEASHATI